MNREIQVAFISRKLKKEFELLKEGRFEDKTVYIQISNALDNLKQNPLCGIKIPKNLWPRGYIQRYSITNLWKYNMSNSWRLIYTIDANEIKIVSIILEWFSHKEYERMFGY
jgi:hypothetical protein